MSEPSCAQQWQVARNPAGRALDNPLRWILTGGEVADITQAQALIEGLHTQAVIGDKGYDEYSSVDSRPHAWLVQRSRSGRLAYGGDGGDLGYSSFAS